MESTDTGASCSNLISMEELEQVTPMLRAVAHPVRLRILDYLRQEDAPRSVSDIEKAARVPQAVVSQQLRILRDQSVLTARRSGNFVFYEIAAPEVFLILDCIRSHRHRA